MEINQREKPKKIKDYKIPFEHLHAGVQEKIEALGKQRVNRTIPAIIGIGVLASVFPLRSFSPFGIMLSGSLINSAIMRNREVKQATNELAKKLQNEEERFVIRPKHGLSHDWPALKQKYPFAYVKGNGDLVLTTRERLLKKLGRMRMTLQEQK